MCFLPIFSSPAVANLQDAFKIQKFYAELSWSIVLRFEYILFACSSALLFNIIAIHAVKRQNSLLFHISAAILMGK